VEQAEGSQDEPEGEKQLSIASTRLSNKEPASNRGREPAPRMPSPGPGRGVSGLFVHGA
jgi:hypothetical protein